MEDKKAFNLQLAEVSGSIDKEISELFTKSISVLDPKSMADSQDQILGICESFKAIIESVFHDHLNSEYAREMAFDLEDRIKLTFKYATEKIPPKRLGRLVANRNAMIRFCELQADDLSKFIDSMFREDANIEVSDLMPNTQHKEYEQNTMLKTQDVVELTGLAKSTIDKHAANGKIKYSKPGGKIRYFNLKDVIEWMNSNTNMTSEEIEQAAIAYTIKKGSRTNK